MFKAYSILFAFMLSVSAMPISSAAANARADATWLREVEEARADTAWLREVEVENARADTAWLREVEEARADTAWL